MDPEKLILRALCTKLSRTARELLESVRRSGWKDAERRDVNHHLYSMRQRGLVESSTDPREHAPRWRLADAQPATGRRAPAPAAAEEVVLVVRGSFVATDEQRSVIEAPLSDRMIVEAGPGTGKTEVACRRIGRAIREGRIVPERVLLISFTRSAVQELRDRIRSASGIDDAARVEIRTLDSFAWQTATVRSNGPTPTGGHDATLDAARHVLREAGDDVLDKLEQYDLVVVDESQDVRGVRAALVLSVLGHLRTECGVTVFGDPAQAIYGFTNDSDDGGNRASSLFEGLAARGFRKLSLTKVHRATGALAESFQRFRELVPYTDHPGSSPDVLRECIAEYAQTLHPRIDEVNADATTMLLFRRRVDALMHSSFMSTRGTEHRLRLSGYDSVTHAWIGWTLSEVVADQLSRSEFTETWARRSAQAPGLCAGFDEERAWALLERHSRRSKGSLDLVRLSELLARTNVPADLCEPDVGARGPVVGTIHAAKGREAERVVLELRSDEHAAGDEADEEEESRVLYVGATRARARLEVFRASKGRRTKSVDGRAVRSLPRGAFQVEVGRSGDIDSSAMVSRWLHASPELARTTQEWLARSVIGQTPAVVALAKKGTYRIMTPREDGNLPIARSTPTLVRAIESLTGGNAPALNPLRVVAVRTISVSRDDPRWIESAHAPYSSSRFFLAPVVKGFVKVGRSR